MGEDTYAPSTYDQVVVYEFYMPLTQESALRVTLDSLFYEDALLPRLQRIGVERLREHFASRAADDDGSLLGRVCGFIEETFDGYSMYRVDGRFRGAPLSTREEAAKIDKNSRYLVDETTAVCRFVFPCAPDEPAKVRFLFEELFVNTIIEQVNGEEEIWVVESGMRNQIRIWRRRE